MMNMQGSTMMQHPANSMILPHQQQQPLPHNTSPPILATPHYPPRPEDGALHITVRLFCVLLLCIANRMDNKHSHALSHFSMISIFLPFPGL
jgi:hypothetical protein